MNIICIAQWWFCGNSEILHCSDVFARCQKLCKPETIFKKTCVNIFYSKNMTPFLNYVTATLRDLFAWHGSYITMTATVIGKSQTLSKITVGKALDSLQNKIKRTAFFLKLPQEVKTCQCTATDLTLGSKMSNPSLITIRSWNDRHAVNI